MEQGETVPKLHVLLRREELKPERLAGKVVIVVDVLFATSTIAHAFDRGAACIWPARSEKEAQEIASRLDAPLLAGEYLMQDLPGFMPATPLALAARPLQGTTLVYATTNGTLALRDAESAAHVYAGALVNGAALVRHVVRAHPDAPVLLLCAGSVDRFNIEDFHGAGHLVAHFERSGNYQLSDAALAAMLLYRGCAADDVLHASRVGRMVCTAAGGREEIACAARADSLDVVPRLQDGCLRRVAA